MTLKTLICLKTEQISRQMELNVSKKVKYVFLKNIFKRGYIALEISSTNEFLNLALN